MDIGHVHTFMEPRGAGSTALMEGGGVQDGSLKRRPLWHINRFEMKTLEKQQMQEGHFDLCRTAPFSFQKQMTKFL